MTEPPQANGHEAGLLATLYVHHHERARRYAQSIVRDEHEAEDVVHDAFVRAFEALPRFEQRGVPVSGWLLRIVRNVALTRLERARRIRVDGEAAATAAAAVPRGDGLGAWLDDLPAAQRQVLVLRFELDLSPAETAAVLDRSPEGVRQLQCRALATLRRRAVSPAPSAPA